MNLPIERRAALLLFIGLMAFMTLGATTEKTVYSDVSNRVLKQKSLQLVQDIRRLVDSYKKKDRELMTEYDKKDRPNMSKGGGARITAAVAERLGPGPRIDDALLQGSLLGRCHIVYWRVKPEALETSKAARAPETIPTSHQRSWSGRRS